MQSKIDEAIGTLIEAIIKKAEEQLPNAIKSKMSKEPNFIKSKIDTYRSWSAFEKLQFYFKLLATLLSVRNFKRINIIDLEPRLSFHICGLVS